MAAFLQKVAEHLFPKFRENPEQLCIVLPNRRAGVFMRRHWSSLLDKPGWSPAIYAVEDFMAELSGLQIIDQAEQLFELYSIYKSDKKEDSDSFETFGRWASVLLQDFEQVDANLVDAPQLFSNLTDIRELETWQIGQENFSPIQQNYLKFWESIGSWHETLVRKMLREGKAWPGLASRMAARNAAIRLAEKPWKKIIFAGFCSLTKAEEQILHTIISSGKGEALWDADPYYLDDKSQEAGFFLRRYRENFFQAKDAAAFTHSENHFGSIPKKMTIAGVARQVSQAKAAAHILGEWMKSGETEQSTAIVLADESLLFPVLHALPPDVGEVNITMGYPMRNTPVAELSEMIFALQENARRFKILSRDGEVKLYHADVIRLLRHPYLRLLFRETEFSEKLAHFIAEHNYVFVTPTLLRTAIPGTEAEFSIIAPVFRSWTTMDEAFDALQQIIETLRHLFGGSEEEMEKAGRKRANVELEFLFQYGKLVRRFRTLNKRFGFISELRTLKGLMAQGISHASLPFYGEPLSGLQIMGMLETRALDFDNVIILSVNENMLPAGRSHHSFIVFDLRKHFGLPVYHEQDAVSAYHFYRLLQRAKNVALLYNTENDAFGSGERSRFIAQLLHELPHVSKDTIIEEKLFDSGVRAADPAAPIVVPRNGPIRRIVSELAAYGFSPSALNSYRKCSLQFYFRYVARIREKEEVEETIGADTLGTVVHAVLEDLYRAHLGKALTKEAIAEMKTRVTALTDEHFKSYYPGEELGYGKNLLTRKVSNRFISNFLDGEKKLVEDLGKKDLSLTVTELETELAAEIEVGAQTVKLRGHADRVDEIGGRIRVIDYKTGQATDKELRVPEWAAIRTNPELDKSFQLLMYALMYVRSGKKNSGELLSGIYTFRELKAGLKTVRTPEGAEALNQEILAAFEAELVTLLSELLDEDKNFVQTGDTDTCSYCSFKGICGRE